MNTLSIINSDSIEILQFLKQQFPENLYNKSKKRQVFVDSLNQPNLKVKTTPDTIFITIFGDNKQSYALTEHCKEAFIALFTTRTIDEVI